MDFTGFDLVKTSNQVCVINEGEYLTAHLSLINHCNIAASSGGARPARPAAP